VASVREMLPFILDDDVAAGSDDSIDVYLGRMLLLMFESGQMVPSRQYRQYYRLSLGSMDGSDVTVCD
jgi:hypothetical protein